MPRCKDGRAHLNAYLDDHAFLLSALLELLQASFRAADLSWAIEIADVLLLRFEDPAGGGFFFTSHDHEALLHRPKPAHDNATPAGNGVAAQALLTLGHWLGETRYSRLPSGPLRGVRARTPNGPRGVSLAADRARGSRVNAAGDGAACAAMRQPAPRGSARSSARYPPGRCGSSTCRMTPATLPRRAVAAAPGVTDSATAWVCRAAVPATASLRCRHAIDKKSSARVVDVAAKYKGDAAAREAVKAARRWGPMPSALDAEQQGAWILTLTHLAARAGNLGAPVQESAALQRAAAEGVTPAIAQAPRTARTAKPIWRAAAPRCRAAHRRGTGAAC